MSDTDKRTVQERIRERIGHQWSDRSFVQSEAVREIMREAADRIDALEKALGNLEVYTSALIESGDCGNWSASETEQVAAARAALHPSDNEDRK